MDNAIVLSIVSIVINALLGIVAYLLRTSLSAKEQQLQSISNSIRELEISSAQHRQFCESTLLAQQNSLEKVVATLEKIRDWQ